jgi:hypothetical protein
MWILGHIRQVTLVSGALTATMIYAAIAPQAAMSSSFGETLDGPLAQVIVRSWGVLIALIGVALIYGASRPAVRPLVLMMASASKIVFIGLVLSQGATYLNHGAGVAVATDSVMVLLFAWYLLAAPRQSGAA